MLDVRGAMQDLAATQRGDVFLDETYAEIDPSKFSALVAGFREYINLFPEGAEKAQALQWVEKQRLQIVEQLSQSGIKAQGELSKAFEGADQKAGEFKNTLSEVNRALVIDNTVKKVQEELNTVTSREIDSHFVKGQLGKKVEQMVADIEEVGNLQNKLNALKDDADADPAAIKNLEDQISDL